MILCKTLLAGLLSLPLSAAFAHGGEDHGAPPALPASTFTVPNTEANSLDFELFAQLNGDTLTVYLDHFADNQPVTKAIIEVESAAFKASLHEVAPGTYQAPAAALNSPGEHSLLPITPRHLAHVGGGWAAGCWPWLAVGYCSRAA
jgi:hypothetical protein